MQSSVVRRVLWVRGLRAFGDGFVSLLLPVYLIALGFGPLAVGALGALFAGVPEIAAKMGEIELKTVLQMTFALYGALGVASALIYRKLPRDLAAEAQATFEPLKKSRKIVYTLAGLFSIDAFG